MASPESANAGGECLTDTVLPRSSVRLHPSPSPPHTRSARGTGVLGSPIRMRVPWWETQRVVRLGLKMEL